MKNWKKPIAAVLAGICCVVGMPQVQLVLPALQAAAAETADTGTVGTLTYTLESDRAVITQCDENAEEVVIPSEIEGKPVLEIGEGAFQFCEKLTSVEIPDTVQTIGKNAFWSCHKLQDVTLPKNLVSVGDNCFRSCGLLEKLDIPETLQKIGLDAFCDTAWLKNQQAVNPLVQVNHILIDGTTYSGTTAEIPGGIMEIGNFAFYQCENLQKVILPESVTKIDWGAFWQCSSLETLTTQGNLTEIGESAFRLHKVVCCVYGYGRGRVEQYSDRIGERVAGTGCGTL